MESSKQDTPGESRRFHLAVWRWHFYAGICVLPLTIILAVSGLAMLAGAPLDRYLRSDLFTVIPRGAPLSATEQAAAVAAAYPDWNLRTLRVAPSAAASSQFDIAPKHASANHGGHGDPDVVMVFVDPYTGAVLGEHAVDATVHAWAKKVHGTLLLGRAGDYIIEVAAGLGVLLIVTGLYLWWPRQGSTLRSALLPDLAAPGRRRWRDLHGAVAAWSAPLLLFFFVSGLAWTPFWGGELVQAWSSLPGEQFTAPLADETHGSLDHGVHREVPWAIERTRLPAASPEQGTRDICADGVMGIDEVIAYARANGFERFRAHWPRGERGVWTVASTTIAGDTQELDGDRIVHLDPATGCVLAEIGFADYSPMGQFMAAGIPLHQADTGIVNLALNVLLCLAVIGMGIAALAACWARRPAGAMTLVPPPLPRDARVWRGAVLVMLAASLAFPLSAATIAAVLAIDLLLLPRLRALGALFE